MNASSPVGGTLESNNPSLVQHVPLSGLLTSLLETERGDLPLTINLLLSRTDGRGVYLLIITICLPAIAIILICLSMMEEDGILIWYAYVAVFGNIVFFGVLAFGIGRILMYWKEIWEMVQSKL